MFKLILFLALPLTVCEATVKWMTRSKPANFDTDNNLAANNNMQLYCGPRQSVIQCFTHPAEKQYFFKDVKQSFQGKSAAFVYTNSPCSYEEKPTKPAVAFILMDSCDNVYGVYLYYYMFGHLLEAPLGGEEWVQCARECSRQKYKPDHKPLGTNDWEVKRNPKQGSSFGGHLIWDSDDDKKNEEDLGYDVEDYYGNSNIADIAFGGTSVQENAEESQTSVKPQQQPPDTKKLFQSDPGVYCDRPYSCLSCSSGRVCVPTRDGNKLYEIGRYHCTAMYPYCNYTSGSCTKNPDPACWSLPNTVESKDFICMRDGYFPAPYDCDRFYSCKDKIAYEHFCPYFPTPYYHPGLKICVATKNFCTDKTSTYHCSDPYYYGKRIPIESTKNYFITCGVNKEVLSVDRCIGNYFFDPATQTCRFECPYQGLFLNVEDCTSYIKCSPLPQGGFLRTDMFCPDGKAFLESEFSCVDRSLVHNCEQPYPDLFDK